MPLVRFVSSRMAAFKSRIDTRFATRAARFRLAVSSGFVVAAVGVLVVGAGTRFGLAQNVWGLNFGSFSEPARLADQGAPEPSPQYQTHHRHRSHLARRKTDEFGNAMPVSLSRQSLCVRLCDGFAFPVGDYHGEGDRAAHAATCQSECPGAETSLFVLPAGSTTIGDATEVGTDRSYSEIPEAFHYTTYVDETCSCHPRAGNRIKSLLHDFTLRRGDVVMTAKGLRVFHGGTSYPYKRRDFVALAQSRDIRSGDRENLRAIERASLMMPAPSGGTEPPALLSDARRPGTRALEHQAKN